MRKMKKLISIILAISLFFLCGNLGLATSNITKQEPTNSIEEILSEYHAKLQLSNSNTTRSTYTYTVQDAIKKETIQQLIAEGYDAYDVNSATFEDVEEILAVDFEKMGLDKKYSYIVTISGKESEARGLNDDSDDNMDGPFEYTFNGVVYAVQYVTVTAADDPAYAKASSVNVLDSNESGLLENCLNTLISTCFDTVWSPLGLVYSICGLDVSDLITSYSSTMNLNCGTNWTRVFTQIYDPYYDQWVNGSCVEYVTAFAYMSGMVYSAVENRYIQVPENQARRTEVSDKYYDFTWRKEKAIYGSESYYIYYDVVGDVKYKYGDDIKVTHYENF